MDRHIEGHFWHERQPDNRVRGRLTWTAIGGGQLDLEGGILPDGALVPSNVVLLGQTLDGIPIVVCNAFVRAFTVASRVSQAWHVNAALIGTHDPEPAVRTVLLTLDGLGSFVSRHAISLEGSPGSREPVAFRWAPDPAPLHLTLEDAEIGFSDRREVDASDDRVSVRHIVDLSHRRAADGSFTAAVERLRTVVPLLEFLADRPLPVQREMVVTRESLEIEHLYQPIVGVMPDDPSVLWLRLPDVANRLSDALERWVSLVEKRFEMVTLLIEEVRFRRRTEPADRVLRLARILELLHRHRHPQATADEPTEGDKVAAVLDSAPADLRAWLRHQMGLGQIRLRQRIGELLAEFDGGLDRPLGDPEAFARVVTKTRNWHTHYSDRNGIAEEAALVHLTTRMWLVVRAGILLELGWPSAEAITLVAHDRSFASIGDRPLT